MSEADRLRDLLREGVVHFFYRKVSGEEREAFGTLNESIINDRFIPTSRKTSRPGPHIRHDSDETVSYFDLDSGEYGEWRSFRVENLISIDQYV